ncbi:hypothetical protein QQ054_16000 [Oscillatoria amoena NRMC-F 0135]|nr:hypothetical protein [Oscillatoria laete-virens]MDL5047519.1 hypothetical protein [Oscillatoria amoena NRMC-F 0135]MDL5054656.1 hypothetical protein [Oscillatoria laete-virens NRMC-F 0139]
MKTILQIILTFILLIATLQADEKLQLKSDFLFKNENGKILKRGIYTTGSKGEVLRYDIRSEKTGELLHTEIPIYDISGEMVMTKVYDGDGDLKAIIVKAKSEYVKLDPEGKPLSDGEFEKIYRSDYKK